MLPRSDKFYVTLIVGFSVVVVIVSVIAAIAAFSGDSETRPEYESAPDPSLVQLPPETLLNNTASDSLVQQQVGAPPMDDGTYLLVHSTTRKIIEALTAPNPQPKLQKAGLSPQESYALVSKVNQYIRNYLSGTNKMVPYGEVTSDIQVSDLKLVRDPRSAEQLRSLQVTSSAAQDFVIQGQNCQATQPFSVNLNIIWSMPLDAKGQPTGKWIMDPSYEVDTPDSSSLDDTTC